MESKTSNKGLKGGCSHRIVFDYHVILEIILLILNQILSTRISERYLTE